MSSTIRLLNHASVKISIENINILTDPWFSGSVFHKGWKLIYEQSEDLIKEYIKDLDYIYISHEHPDHFSPNFFLNKEYQSILLKKKVKILFQETKDKRVLSFLQKKGYEVIEIPDDKFFSLNPKLKIKIIKFGYIDSAIIIEGSKEKILNLNDCPLNEINEIKNFRKKHGHFDLLLTQFSYAAWKGGKDNSNYRKEASKDKIKTLINQYKILGCKSVIPFASFIYFSNHLNNYMNDEINKPHIFQNLLPENINSIVLKPGEVQSIEKLNQDNNSLNFWKENYDFIKSKELEKFNDTVSFNILKDQFTNYKKKIFNLNSRFLIFASSKIKFLKFFQPVNIYLIDHNKNYLFSFFDNLREIRNTNSDISMHSESLSFIFKNDFGYDTLTVNGCFSASKEGFIKSTRTFAIGSLNSMGLRLNLLLLLNIKLVIFFLKLLRKVAKKL
ncbi:MBL fold metallo-hydrolase [Pelagibacteraceae bacterium]|jgi:UDP-MurNAc hydroxylase|nr:MBL fold metallo-hydrolase [Pelagibacteraceae bacterium]